MLLKVWYLHISLSVEPTTSFSLYLCIGRSGRAGRSGEAITFFTEEDKPFLRNIANVLISSGCEVPSWIMALPKLKRKKHRVQRDPISTLPDED
jgi:ATP-dependent RNA helicase DDX52/ROK1